MKMNHTLYRLIKTTVLISTLTVIPLSSTSKAAELGGGVDLKLNDNKQELKNTMEQIAKLVSISKQQFADNRNEELTAKYSGCKLQTSQYIDWHDGAGITTFLYNFSDIDINSIDKCVSRNNSNEQICSIELTTIDFKNTMCRQTSSEKMCWDAVDLKVMKQNFPKLKILLSKAIEFCQQQ